MAVLAIHNCPDIQSGKAVRNAGAAMARVGRFKAGFGGKGGQ